HSRKADIKRRAVFHLKWSGIVRTGLLLVLIGVLELACRSGWISRTTLIPPSEMAVALVQGLVSGRFNEALVSTLTNVGAAVLISVVFGFAAGVTIHAIPRLRRAVEPFAASSYAIPGFIFYVPLLGVFGVNDAPLISVGCILAIPSMILATFNGLDRIPGVLMRVSKTYRLDLLRKVFLIMLPCAAPYLFSGVRLCLAYAFIGVIASEFILSDRGIGYSIAFAYHDFDVRTMYALMLLLIVLVTGANMTLQFWENRLMLRRRKS
ncbi:MAG: ABC transporter permease, partial [Pseudolabrys sp.]